MSTLTRALKPCAARPSLSFGRALPPLLTGPHSNPLSNIDLPERCVLTYRGRTALAAGCRILGLSKNDEVLAPAYNCGMEIDVLRWLGCKVTLYKVDNYARIDCEDIKRKQTDRTRAVYVTHYFGWEQDIAELSAWCAQNNLLLIEDCALALFSRGQSGQLGRVGDLSIFSFPKSLPVPDGGAFVLNRRADSGPRHLQAPPNASVLLKTLSLMLVFLSARMGNKTSASQNGAAHAAANGESDERCGMPSSYYFNGSESRWAASRMTLGILARIQPHEIIERRRRNYVQLHDMLCDVPGARPLMGALPPDICPLAMPMLVRNRARVWGQLQEEGIGAGKWWAGYHRELAWDKFPEACFLKDNVLTLPIHQDLGSGHIKRIGEVFRRAIQS